MQCWEPIVFLLVSVQPYTFGNQLFKFHMHTNPSVIPLYLLFDPFQYLYKILNNFIHKDLTLVLLHLIQVLHFDAIVNDVFTFVC